MKPEHDDLTRYLDGELPFDALPNDLQQEAGRFERLVAFLANDRVRAPQELREAVMNRVRAAARSPWRRSWAWVSTPQTIHLRPATGALALAAAAALVLLARPRGTPPVDAPVATTAAGALVRFVLVAPSAQTVAVTGDFTGWDPAGVPLEDRRGTGVWVAELELDPGMHNYVFIVNGAEWRPDPHASRVDDGFGQQNSVLLVPPRSSNRGT